MKNEENLSSDNKHFYVEENESYKVYTKQFDVFSRWKNY